MKIQGIHGDKQGESPLETELFFLDLLYGVSENIVYNLVRSNLLYQHNVTPYHIALEIFHFAGAQEKLHQGKLNALPNSHAQLKLPDVFDVFWPENCHS